jgi:transglutaminase-like putative cysteine protease
MLRLLFVLCLVCCLPAGLQAEDPVEAYRADPGLPYLAEAGPAVTYDVDSSVVVTAPYGTKVLRVWLPIPQSDRGQEIRDSRLETFPALVTPRIASESTYGNQFAYFEFHRPLGGQMIRHRFRATVRELRWNVDPQRVTRPSAWPDGFAPYLRKPSELADSVELQAVLREFAPQGPSTGRELMAAMEWIQKNLTYDHQRASLRADVQHALSTRHGHCSDYHGLCAALGRQLGYPTRVTYGLNLFPKNSPSHCKLEAFLPPYGWVSFDLSETQKLIDRIRTADQLNEEEKLRLVAAARDRLLRGFRENTWLFATRGTEYELAPPASQSVRVVRTIYAEADGVPLPDPDPANPKQREFAWMTINAFRPDRPATHPFDDWRSLQAQVPGQREVGGR